MSKQRRPAGKTGQRKGTAERYRKKNRIGTFFVMLQALISIIFMAVLTLLDMLPMKYVAMVAMILVFLWCITLTTQVASRKRGISGKLFSLLIVCVLGVGTYYIGKTNNMISMITGGGFKVDKMVVAVRADDIAESIEDASDYSFGVQFQKGSDNMQAAVADIQEELNGVIDTVEYSSVQEQAAALLNGEVDAIIYNEAYEDLMRESSEGFKDNIKKIYETSIRAELDLGGESTDDSLIKKPFSVYISGIDTYGEVTETSRSDVNIIAVVNPVSHQILLVTTPRDYYVEIPDVSEGSCDKLTHAGVYGIDASMATLGQLYETDINYYVRLNFTSMIEIIDILGGVDVYSELEFSTGEDAGYVMDIQQGYNHLDGKQALAFCRERHNLPDGDNQRGKNQQAMITAMLKKVLSPTMLLKANGIMNQISNDVETNVSQPQLNSLIKKQLSTNASWTIQSVAATGDISEGYCYSTGYELLSIIIPDYDSVNEIIELSNTVEDGEELLNGEKLN